MDHKIFWHNEDFRYRFHEKAYGCPMHIHQHAEFVYVFSGSIELVILNKTYVLKKGDGALIFPWQLHGYFGENDNNIFICVFAEKFIPEFYNITKNYMAVSNVFVPGNAFVLTLREFIDSSDSTAYDMKSLLYKAIGTFLKNTTLIKKKNKATAIDKIISYSVNNISSELNLSTVAQELGYSSNYLSHIIKNTVGINFSSLLNCIKFEIAKNLLINTDKSITEIAHLSGFGTERSFNRVFKDLSGLTPGEYKTSK